MTTYAYSRDEERYHGPHDSIEAALAEANMDALPDHEPGEVITVLVAPVKPALEILSAYADSIGCRAFEHAEDTLSDETAAEEPSMKLPADQHKQLGMVIVNWLIEHCRPTRFGVGDPVKHQIVVDE